MKTRRLINFKHNAIYAFVLGFGMLVLTTQLVVHGRASEAALFGSGAGIFWGSAISDWNNHKLGVVVEIIEERKRLLKKVK